MRKILIVTLLAMSAIAKANVNPWLRIDKAPANIVQSVAPASFTLFVLQEAQLKTTLFNMPQGAVMQFPSPDGKMVAFRMEETPCMEPALAAKYPEIKTFTGVALHNKAITAKFEYTYLGFHAMVFDGASTYIIQPYSNPSQGYYLIFYKRDLILPDEEKTSCLYSNAEQLTKGEEILITNAKTTNPQYKLHGDVFRTYRLAMACTGEYSIKVAGSSTPSKALSLSAITTTVNRINGIYEREVGVRMNLIANNEDIIYLDGTTDPYSNSGVSGMSENQNNLNSTIGNNNFDIGHLMVTTGTAIAQLGSVCNIAQKAQGVSGQPNPIGAAFDIDFVAHEIGHQFGANHSFNANTGSCNGNGVASAAYEPGSGSTIMGYAGICGAGDNLQPHSDPNFHVKSLDEISNFLEFGGSVCAVISSSNNTPPVVPPIAQSYNIPHRTPFELIAPEAVDTDFDTLTYCWEQWDLGSFGQSFANTMASGPIFRSFPPSFSRTRVFPSWDKLLWNVTNYLGEKLPETSRVLKFKLTVRDIYIGKGTFNRSDDEVTLNVTTVSGPFEVNSPNNDTDYWQCGASKIVTWNVANTTLPPVNCANVDITLSVDGGFTYPITLAANTPNDGSETITVPNNIYAKGCRVKVKGSGNVFFDISNQNFSIFPWTASVNAFEQDLSVNIYPVPAKDVLNIELKEKQQHKAIITNTLGQQIWVSDIADKASVQIASWAAGVYSLQLINTNTNEILNKKFVVH